MEIINRRQRMFSISRKLRREAKTVAFVPTMGALHAGSRRGRDLLRRKVDLPDLVIFPISDVEDVVLQRHALRLVEGRQVERAVVEAGLAAADDARHHAVGRGFQNAVVRGVGDEQTFAGIRQDFAWE